jgi:hypothetical protein
LVVDIAVYGRVFGARLGHELVGCIHDRLLARTLLCILEIHVLTVCVDVCPVAHNLPRCVIDGGAYLVVEEEILGRYRRYTQ